VSRLNGTRGAGPLNHVSAEIADELFEELVERLIPLCIVDSADAIENACGLDGWWQDLARYCDVTGEKPQDVLPDLRGAAHARIEKRERDSR
jgi:hypothetical protein